jgi:hypothetical protein
MASVAAVAQPVVIADPSGSSSSVETGVLISDKKSSSSSSFTYQRALLLRQPKQRLELVEDWIRPSIEADDEVLIKIGAIGLNPM